MSNKKNCLNYRSLPDETFSFLFVDNNNLFSTNSPTPYPCTQRLPATNTFNECAAVSGIFHRGRSVPAQRSIGGHIIKAGNVLDK